jgi:acyl carrier protein
MSDLSKQLFEVIQDVFDDETLELSEETVATEVDGWDSLMHVNVVIALEQRFGISFATAEISAMKNHGANLGTLRAMIEQKLQAIAEA